MSFVFQIRNTYQILHSSIWFRIWKVSGSYNSFKYVSFDFEIMYLTIEFGMFKISKPIINSVMYSRLSNSSIEFFALPMQRFKEVEDMRMANYESICIYHKPFFKVFFLLRPYILQRESPKQTPQPTSKILNFVIINYSGYNRFDGMKDVCLN